MAIDLSFGRRPSRRRQSLHVRTARSRGSAITASGATLNISDRREATRVRTLRQGWQRDAWSYRDQIGELHYAFGFVSHATARMRYYPGGYPTGSYDEAPVAIEEANLSPDTVAAAYMAMNAFASGQVAMSEKMGRLSENVSVAGEAYVLGRTDPSTGLDDWSIRSIDEIVVQAARSLPGSPLTSQYSLREVPVEPTGGYGATPLDPDLTYIARVWQPHPRFMQLADSSMRAIMDLCEELLILSRNIRAVGRSALAGNGMLLLPTGLMRRNSLTGDNRDPQSNAFLADLTESMMAPIADEGSAQAVVPMLSWGDREDIAAVRHLVFARPLDPQLAAQRLELLGRIATGIDLPREVLTGVADLNHWSAWQVDDNTFRHHLEPHVITVCDMHAVGYLRPSMIALGADPAEVDRVVTWYDPTDLVTHPDLTTTAQALYDRDVISSAALRRVSGFQDTDAPDPLELELRLVRNTRTWPPNVLMALLGKLDPSLTIPAITTAGTIPGIKGGAVDVGPPPLPPGEPAAAPPLVPGPPEPAPDDTSAPTDGPPSPLGAAITASAATERLSRRLADIDAVLRARLQAAASAAMARVLERAGSKLRTKLRASKSPVIRQQASNPVPNTDLAHVVGEAIVADAGLTAGELTATDWADFGEVFEHWTAAAQADALDTAAAIVGGIDEVKMKAVAAEQAKARARAWTLLAQMMTARAAELLYKPAKAPVAPPRTDTPAPAPPWSGANLDTLAPQGMIRSALAVAGGSSVPPSSFGVSPSGAGVFSAPAGQVGTGDAIDSVMAAEGASSALYEWRVGAPVKPFDPHQELDGVQFSSWDDPALANPDPSFPENDYFVPGDHVGCCCDFAVLWEPGEGDTATSDGGSTDVSPPAYPNWPQVEGSPVQRSTTPYSGGVKPGAPPATPPPVPPPAPKPPTGPATKTGVPVTKPPVPVTEPTARFTTEGRRHVTKEAALAKQQGYAQVFSVKTASGQKVYLKVYNESLDDLKTLPGTMKPSYLDEGRLSAALNAVADLHEMNPLTDLPPTIVIQPSRVAEAHFAGKGDRVLAWVNSGDRGTINMTAASLQQYRSLGDWHMPMASGKEFGSLEGRLTYTMCHEYGHLTDFAGDLAGPVSNRQRSRAAYNKLKATGGKRTPMWGGLSKYGREDVREAYAETFAEWTLSRGTTTNRAAQLYAKTFGWSNP